EAVTAVGQPDDPGAKEDPSARDGIPHPEAGLVRESQAVGADRARNPGLDAAAVAVRVVEAPAPVGQAFDVARLREPPLTGLRREMDAVRRDGAVNARRSRGLDRVVDAYPAVRKDDRAWIRQPLTRR